LALKVDPTFAFAWDRMARAEFRMNDLILAEQHWKHSLKMKPDLVSAKVGLSNICMQRKQYENARKLLQTALRLEEANIPAHLNMVELNVLTGNIKEAVSCSDLTLRLAPRDTRVRLVAAQTYMLSGDVERAANLIKLVEKDDESARDTEFFKLVSGQLASLLMAKVGAND
jgi:Flp pilus assembly protein TadD